MYDGSPNTPVRTSIQSIGFAATGVTVANKSHIWKFVIANVETDKQIL